MDSQGKRRTQNSGPKSLFADCCSQRLLRFYGKRRHFGKPGYAAVYKFEVSESVKSYFRQAVIFRKKALRRGKAFFCHCKITACKALKTQYIHIPLQSRVPRRDLIVTKSNLAKIPAVKSSQNGLIITMLRGFCSTTNPLCGI